MLRFVIALVALSLPALVNSAASTAAAQDGALADAAPRIASISLPPRLERVLRDYEIAWKAGDEEALALLFVEDGFVPGSDGWLRGRDAIRAKYSDSNGDLRLRAVAFSESEKVGFIVGAYGYGDEAASRDWGHFVLALERDSPGSPWLIAADLDRGIEQPE